MNFSIGSVEFRVDAQVDGGNVKGRMYVGVTNAVLDIIPFSIRGNELALSLPASWLKDNQQSLSRVIKSMSAELVKVVSTAYPTVPIKVTRITVGKSG